MNCIKCGYVKATSMDSRGYTNPAKNISCRKRDHKCPKCGEPFPTVEVPGTIRMNGGKVVEIIIFADSADQVTVIPRDQYVPRIAQVPRGTTAGSS